LLFFQKKLYITELMDLDDATLTSLQDLAEEDEAVGETQ
jgi:hypothetical protein